MFDEIRTCCLLKPKCKFVYIAHMFNFRIWITFKYRKPYLELLL